MGHDTVLPVTILTCWAGNARQIRWLQRAHAVEGEFFPVACDSLHPKIRPTRPTAHQTLHVCSTRQVPGSSVLLQTPECSEYHLSEQSPLVSAFCLRLQLSGTNSLFLSVILPLCQIFHIFLENLSGFKHLFFSPIALEHSRRKSAGRRF